METPKQDGVKTAARLVRDGGAASLSVIDIRGGGPFVTLVNVAADDLLRPVILTSALSHHTQCLGADPRGACLLHAQLPENGDPLTTFRVTLTGVFQRAPRPEVEDLFLARHPYAELYSALGDFSFWRMEPQHAHIIAGFGRAYSVPHVDLVKAS